MKAHVWIGVGVMFVMGCASEEQTKPTNVKSAAVEPATQVVPAASRTPPKINAPLPKPVNIPWFWRVASAKTQWVEHHRARLGDGQVVEATFDQSKKAMVVAIKDAKGKTIRTRAISTTLRGVNVIHHKGLVYMVLYHPISSGAMVVALDARDLSQRWSYRAKGLGDVSHSKYRNQTQLDVRQGRLVIFGREAFGSYIESVTLDTGKLISNRVTSTSWTRVDWPQDLVFDDITAAKPRVVQSKTKKDTSTYRLTLHKPDAKRVDHVLTVMRVKGKKDVLWRKTYPKQFMGQATMVKCGGVLVVGLYSRIASGLTLEALDAKTGTVHWTKHAYGAGPVDHSQYANQVVLRCSEDEHVLAYGKESAANYIERWNFRSGTLLSNIRIYP